MTAWPHQATTLIPGRARTTLGAVLVTAGVVISNVAVPAVAHASRGSASAWTSPTAIPSAKTQGAPALEAFNGLLYAAWSGDSSPSHIWYSAFNGASWTPQKTIPSALTIEIDQASHIAMAVYNGDLYVTYAGRSGPAHYVWYTAFNGTTWTAQSKVPSAFTNGDGLGLAPYGGKLYLAYQGQSGKRDWYAAFNGTTWTASAPIPGAVVDTNGAALTAYGSDLFASWGTSTGDPTYAAFNGSAWTSPQRIPSVVGGTDFSLAVSNSFMYDMWDNYNTGDIDYAFYNGTNWSSQIVIPSSSSASGPALAAFGASLVAAWDALSASNAIEYSAGP
jgi:hypothetical protein